MQAPQRIAASQSIMLQQGPLLYGNQSAQIAFDPRQLLERTFFIVVARLGAANPYCTDYFLAGLIARGEIDTVRAMPNMFGFALI